MSLVQQLCGVYPEGFEKLDITSNPNFVFENDPNYSARQLFDVDGNKVFVNSFVECEHYVSGGWGLTPLENTELFLQDILFYISITFIVFTFLRPKIEKMFKN